MAYSILHRQKALSGTLNLEKERKKEKDKCPLSGTLNLEKLRLKQSPLSDPPTKEKLDHAQVIGGSNYDLLKVAS